MFFDDLMEEFAMLDFQDDAILLEWLHRLFRYAEEHEVYEIPRCEAIANRICDARAIDYDADPHFPPPNTTAKGDPIYASWLLEESVHTLRLQPNRPSPLFRYYGTTRIQIELYLGIRSK